jgi:hypothetical protein
VPVADNAVDRPLVDVVIEAIDPDDDVSDEVTHYVLDASKGLRLCKSYTTADAHRTSLKIRTRKEEYLAFDCRGLWRHMRICYAARLTSN